MVDEPSSWNNTCERFVAFLDIMGFKDMVLRIGHKDIRKMLESFQMSVGAIEISAKRKLAVKSKEDPMDKTYFGYSIILPVLFSDSILLVSEDDSKYSALDILFMANWIFEQAMIEGIPIKGAIAHGEQTADFERSLHFGKPLIDAYELQDELLLYGIVLHHTTEKRLYDIDIIDFIDNRYVFKYKVPMKSGVIHHNIIDWSGFAGMEKQISDRVSELYQSVSGAPRIYVDNTIELIQHITKRETERTQNKE